MTPFKRSLTFTAWQGVGGSEGGSSGGGDGGGRGSSGILAKISLPQKL